MDPHPTALPPHATARAVTCGDPPDACVAGETFFTLLTHADAWLTHADARASACVDGSGGAPGGMVEIARHAPRVTAARLERQRPGVTGREPGDGMGNPGACTRPTPPPRPRRTREQARQYPSPEPRPQPAPLPGWSSRHDEEFGRRQRLGYDRGSDQTATLPVVEIDHDERFVL